MSPLIFLITGAGRCGTMSLANWLSSEDGVVCLHEGKERDLETPGRQWLPFLTLQNYQAYAQPGRADELLQRARQGMADKAQGLRAFGDAAYNYAPFVGALSRQYPDARLVVLVRDGRDFVRSVITDEVPDPTPVGWLDDDRPVDKVETFVALGRLRPLPGTPEHETWSKWSLVEKNAWLWSESYQLILDGMAAWPERQVMVLRFEDLFGDVQTQYLRIRAFLGLAGDPSPQTLALLELPINARRRRPLPHWHRWSADVSQAFERRAGDMMQRLGYATKEHSEARA